MCVGRFDALTYTKSRFDTRNPLGLSSYFGKGSKEINLHGELRTRLRIRVRSQLVYTRTPEIVKPGRELGCTYDSTYLLLPGPTQSRTYVQNKPDIPDSSEIIRHWIISSVLGSNVSSW